ncbi:MAG: SRPBCC family protein, partial [Polyangiaceae bacterium]
RIVMSWSWAVGGELDESGRISRVEIELKPIGDGTELTFTHADLASEASEKSHAWGWGSALDKLVRHVETPAREGRRSL